MEKIKYFITRIKENKYLRVLSFLILWLLIILVGRMSYAFLNDEMNTSQGGVDVSTGEVDKLTFTNGQPLTLPKFNVKTFTTNQTGETSGTATLTAGPDSIYAPATYHDYLDINTNTFVHSISDGTPELLLTVTGPDGEITSLPSLNYITVGNVSGFDITTRKNKISLTPNSEGQTIRITSSSPSTTQTWTVKLTFLKQTGDQSANAGKTFSANLILQQNILLGDFNGIPLTNKNYSPNKVTCQNGTAEYDDKYKSVILSQINERTYCTLGYEEPTNKEYLNTKISSLVGNGQAIEEQATIDNSTFTNPTTMEQTSYAQLVNDATNPWTWDNTSKTWTSSNHGNSSQSSIEFSPNVSGAYQISYSQSSEKNYDYGTIYKNETEIKNLKGETDGNFFLGQLTTTDKIKITYKKDSSSNVGDDTLSFSVQKGTYNENIVTEQAGIRYEGKSPDNYIWFNNELWRIIGVFDTNIPNVGHQNLVKIIRNESIGGLAWDKNNKNNWVNSSLKNLLNGAYLNAENGTGTDYCYGYYVYIDYISANCDYREIGIKDGYREMIENVTWYLGGPADSSHPANQFYVDERDLTKKYSGNATTWEGQIGLMYASDYGYSVTANTCDRNSNLVDYDNSNCTGQSWLYGKGCEWTITHNSSSSDGVFHVDDNGTAYSYEAYHGYAVRPVLYLKSNKRTIGGDGSLENPYVLERENATP